MIEYADSVVNNNVDPTISIKILEKLKAELKIKKPYIDFGIGQDSAGEAIIHLIDMLEVPNSSFKISPITMLFEHKITKDIYCENCKKKVTSSIDNSIILNDFDKKKPLNILKNVSIHSKLENYKCDLCKEKDTSILKETIIVCPEIIIIRFNIYDHTQRKNNKLEKTFTMPGLNENYLYKLLGYVEHSGTLSGGHYWATCVRKKEIFIINDMNIIKSDFKNSSNIYLAVYHVFKD